MYIKKEEFVFMRTVEHNGKQITFSRHPIYGLFRNGQKTTTAAACSELADIAGDVVFDQQPWDWLSKSLHVLQVLKQITETDDEFIKSKLTKFHT